MTTSRWWIAVYYAGSAVTAAVVLLTTRATVGGDLLALAVLAVLGALFPVIGWPRMCDGAEGWLFAVLLVVGLGVGAAASAPFLLFQAAAMPMLWMLTGSTRVAITWNAAIATSGFLGASVGSGFQADGVAQAAVTQAIALAFTIAMGLWLTHVIRIAVERGALLEQLRSTQGELEALHREAGAGAERERFARELHDTIAQSLAGIVMLAQRGRRELSRPGSTAASAATTLDLIESSALDALAEARALIAATARVSGDGSPLTDTLAKLGERFERETGVAVTVAAEPVGAPRAVEIVVLRCTQEGLANVRKHAGAHSALVTLRREGADAVLTVADDGIGLGGGPAPLDRGFGLGGMRDRVGLVGGSVGLSEGESGRGAVLRVQVPLASGPGEGA